MKSTVGFLLIIGAVFLIATAVIVASCYGQSKSVDDLYIYDFGNGTYVATPVQGIGEWIVKLYYLLYDDSGDDDEYVCPPNS